MVVCSGWQPVKDLIDAHLQVSERNQIAETARRELLNRQNTRKLFVKEKYNKLKKAQTPDGVLKFPTYERFVEFESVKPFWQPDPKEQDETEDEGSGDESVKDVKPKRAIKAEQDVDAKPAPLSSTSSSSDASASTYKSSKDKETDPRDRKWKRQLDQVVAEVKAYVEKTRISCIRQIVSATTNKFVYTLSTKPDDYDEETYDEDFFNTITSHFIVRKTRSAFGYYNPGYVALPYPAVLKNEPAPTTNAITVKIIRQMLKLGNLDEDTATTADLDALGQLAWLDHTGRGRERTLWSWPDLVS